MEGGIECVQQLTIEGPGLRGWIEGEGYVDGKWQMRPLANACLEMDDKYPLKAFATADLSYSRKFPIDGVVKNLRFTNAVGEMFTNACPAPPTPEPPAPEPPAPEQECGCYAIDEEIPIENGNCILNLGSFPDSFPEVWSFSFDLKINYVPPEPTDPRWFFSILEVVMDKGYPNKLFRLGYFQQDIISMWTTKTTMSSGMTYSGGSAFAENEWYKITISGSPEEERCQQTLVIEGPGLRSYFWGEGYVDGKWSSGSITTDCPYLVPEDNPLKAYASRDVTNSEESPMDGVVRNLVFTNLDDDTTIVSPCSVPEPPACGCYADDEEIAVEEDKCVLDLGTSADTAGDWSFTFEFKAYSWPNEPRYATDSRSEHWIISGKVNKNVLRQKPDYVRQTILII